MWRRLVFCYTCRWYGIIALNRGLCAGGSGNLRHVKQNGLLIDISGQARDS